MSSSADCSRLGSGKPGRRIASSSANCRPNSHNNSRSPASKSLNKIVTWEDPSVRPVKLATLSTTKPSKHKKEGSAEPPLP